MNAQQIIEARINELEQDMKKVVDELKDLQRPGGASMASMKTNFEQISKYKDQILGLKSGIAELKYVKGLL